MAERVTIFGCGGHARSVADTLLAARPDTVLVFVDSNARPAETIYGFPVQVEAEAEGSFYFFASGNNGERRRLRESLGSGGLVNVIAPNSYIGRDVKLGRGIFIASYAHIGPLAEIGDNVIVNTHACLDHETTVGAHSQIGPQAAIGGRVTIGEEVFIGIGSTVINCVSICSGVTIGAGAVVIADITEPGTYVGVPARRTK